MLELGGGLGAKWRDFDVAAFRGCDLGPYSAARPVDAPAAPGAAARAAGPPRRGHLVRLPRGLWSAALAVRGRGGAPAFRVVDARGRTVLDASEEKLDRRALVLRDGPIASALWKAPPAGRYWVVGDGIAKVRSVLGTKPPRVRATVRGRGARRTLRWRVAPRLQRGQKLVLAETADGVGGRELVTTRSSGGSRRFRPVVGPRGKRAIEATILTQGFGNEPRTVASFRPPRPATPRRPHRVDVRRRGRRVVVRWRPSEAGLPARRFGWRRGSAPAGACCARSAAGALLRLRDIPAAQPVRVASERRA